ncbi:MAG TPA: HepT-like ribonuclease domain-containing protein [Myxococcota bacterium]|nr:HepT-like ribonuclease domain-containing protein [Myxococcota bacterium]
MTEAERERVFSAVRDSVLGALSDAMAIYVYGSYARGDDWPSSDVDVAVLLPPKRRIDDPLGLMASIAARIGRDVDVVDLRAAGDTLRGEVLRDGHTVFASNAETVLDWEACAMTRYARHQEEIRDLLDDFRRTSVGYARFDIAAQKISSLQRCVARAHQELAGAGTTFATNFTAQDAAILNVIRACETAIDLANMMIRQRKLGIPNESRESFAILAREGILEAELGTRLQKMVGFRNLAVHRYHALDLRIVEAVITSSLEDALAFAQVARSVIGARNH